MGTLVKQITRAEGYSYVGEIIDDMSLIVDEDVRARFKFGKDITARDYLLCLREQKRIKSEFKTALEGTDALLTPTVAEPALKVDQIDQSDSAAGLTQPVNLIEYCALSLPNGFTSNGLPSSLQIICAPHMEALALRIGWAYEDATEWNRNFPEGLG